MTNEPQVWQFGSMAERWAKCVNDAPELPSPRKPIARFGQSVADVAPGAGRLLLLLALTISLATGGCGRPYEFRGTQHDPAKPAPEIVGTNWDASTFRLGDMRGRVSLVFFGYTFCPDVCPTTLSEMRRLHQALGKKAERIAVVFVSVDPERDTPERLAAYVPLFGEQFYGVHVDPAALDELRSAYGVIAEKR